MDATTADEFLWLPEALARSDADAEDLFVRRFMPRVRSMMLARTRKRELADDLTQEAILQSLCALRKGQLREAEKLPQFVLGVARNVLHHHFLELRRTPLHDETVENIPAAVKNDPLLEAERQRIAAEAVASLDPTDRAILQMTLLENLKPAAIARQLGMSDMVVRQRKTRATRRMIDFVRNLSQSASPKHSHTGKER